MAEFQYTALDTSGQEVKGFIDASDEQQAREKLIAQNLSITSIKNEDELTWVEYFSKNNRKISRKDILIFTNQFSNLTKNGTPIIMSLVFLEKYTDNLKLKKQIKKIRIGVEAGSSLYEQFSKYPATFSPTYLNLIKIGEESGTLVKILENLNMFLKKSEDLKLKVDNALKNEAIVIFTTSFTIFFLMAFVIPRYTMVFENNKAKLIYSIQIFFQIIFAVSRFTRNNAIILLIGLFAIIWGLIVLNRRLSGKRIFDNIIIKLPITGQLIINYAINVFSSNLALQLKSGISVTKALEITNNTIENSVLKAEFNQIKINVESGTSIGNAISKYSVISEKVIHMISIGDQSGSIENMFEDIADIYEDEAKKIIDTMSTIIEFMLTIILGAIVVLIVISYFLPTFSMSKAIQ